MKNNNKFFKQRIEKLEIEIIHLLKLNNEIKQNSKKEIDQIKNEQMINLRICMNNFKELKNYAKYLENNCLYLYELRKDLAAQFNLSIAEYGLEYMDDDGENFYNYNVNFK